MKSFLYVCFAMLLGFTAHGTTSDPPNSLYNFAAQLTNQASQSHGLDVYRGKPVLVTMFYSSCPTACPLLIDTVRAVERSVPEAQRQELRVLLISIDPEHDTPAALAKLAQQRRIDTSRWTLARADEKTVRKSPRCSTSSIGSSRTAATTIRASSRCSRRLARSPYRARFSARPMKR